MSVIVSSLRKQRVNISLTKIYMGKFVMIDAMLTQFFYNTCVNFNESWHLGGAINFSAHGFYERLEEEEGSTCCLATVFTRKAIEK